MGDYVSESLDANGCCKFCHDDGPTKCTEQANCLNVRPGDELNVKWESTVMAQSSDKKPKVNIIAKTVEEFQNLCDVLKLLPDSVTVQFEFMKFGFADENIIHANISKSFYTPQMCLPSGVNQMVVNDIEYRLYFLNVTSLKKTLIITIPKEVFLRTTEFNYLVIADGKK